MKSVLKIAVILILNNLVIAQGGIHKVEYLCKSNGLFVSRGYSGLNTLYFTDTTSLYIHNEWPKETIYTDEGVGVIGCIVSDKEGMSIYFNFKNNRIIWKEAYGKTPRHSYILYDTIPQIDWEITTETMTIEGIETIKAEGEFGGRIYSAWFAPSIPVPYGPYKLNGLPGLILAAVTKDGKISWRLKSIEFSTSARDEISPPNDGMLMNIEEFEQFLYDWATMLESKYGTKTLERQVESTLEKRKYMFYTKFKQKGYKAPNERKRLREKERK